MKDAFVTGGCGFIGSHLIDRLLADGCSVSNVDSLATGVKEYVAHHDGNKSLKNHYFDLKDLAKVEGAMAGCDTVFHFAANADIRRGLDDTFRDLERNVITTYNVLESMRKHDVKDIVFASSAAVYGDQKTFPTPEDAPKTQTSFYGASKLSCEAFIEAFCEAYGMRSWMFRFVSVVGERHPHGVTYDFVKKLLANPRELEIFGDGRQRKSFLHVQDCVDGFMHAHKHAKGKVNVFNIGNVDTITVSRVADIIVEEMGLKGVRFNYTGGDRGWIGDAPVVHLSIQRLRVLGWEPKIGVEEGIRRTARWLLANKWIYDKRR
ncbi:MAG: NAD-dependent epimerase/dehydratase family protein [Euryarchaeota archaeon]|nr:NAD-dependent epimerase/dehydratase family protein [Euryarchaeota archaeon]